MKDGSNTRVVVLFPGALGDLVLAEPALRAVRERHAGAELVLAVQGWLRALATTAGLADATASLDDADAAGLFGGGRVPAWLGVRPRLYAWIGTRDPEVGARLRSLAGRAALLPVVRGDGAEHASVEYLRQVGAPLDVAPMPRWPLPEPTPHVHALGARPLLAVHPGAGSVAKRWPVAGFRALVERWQRAGGAAVELVGPADLDVPSVGAVHRAVGWSLPEVAMLLARCAGYAGNDSGVSHLAGAVGARGIAMFGPTRAARWCPRGGIVAVDCGDAFPDDDAATREAGERAWRALAGAGCLDKLQDRT